MAAAPYPHFALTPNSAPDSLTFTGERFLPEVRGPIWYEHWHRYAVCAPLVAGKRVLDAACGEGYGSSLLARHAATVTGVDIGTDAIAHATARYARDNLGFAAASVTALPLRDASVDAVISFETVEHLREQEAMLAEFRRVLAPDGFLVISSPNRPVYNEGALAENHYHVRELDRAELQALLAPLFPQQAWHAQRVIAQSALWAEAAPAASAAPVAFDRLPAPGSAPADAPADPMYFVVVCGAHGACLPALPSLSLFDDGEQSLWHDYARALARERTLAWDELDARHVAEERLAELIAATNALASERAVAAAQGRRIAELDENLATTQAAAQTAIDRVEAELHAREAERAKTWAALAALQQSYAELEQSRLELAERGASLQQQLAATTQRYGAEVAAHDATRAHLRYRETARGWIRFPLHAVRKRLSE